MQPINRSHSAPGSALSFNPRGFFVWITVYFVLHIITRSLISQNLQLDEAEQVILSQDWLWGYGSQPPLYTWIQRLLFEVFGLHVFSLALFKNLCLWAVYVFVFLSARELFSEDLAVVASLSLFFIPQLAWESQRDQTHLVLATACAAATLFVFISAAKIGQSRWFLLFGLISGLGVLSKYNFAILPVALLTGALLTPPIRPRIWNRRMIWACVIFMVIVGPHLWWALHHQHLVTSQAHKFEIRNEGGWLTSAGIVGRFLVVSLLFIAPPLLVISLLSFRSVRGILKDRSSLHWNHHFKFLLTTMAVGLAIVLVMTLVFRVTHLRERWLQPLLFPLPLLFIGILSSTLDRQNLHRLHVTATVVAAAVLFLINGTVLFASAIGKAHNLNFPFENLAQRIHQVGPGQKVIAADGFFLGGNLKMRIPESRVIVPPLPDSISNQAPLLFVWKSSGTNLPPMLNLRDSKGGAPIPQYIEMPSQNGGRRTERIGVLLIQNPSPTTQQPLSFPQI